MSRGIASHDVGCASQLRKFFDQARVPCRGDGDPLAERNEIRSHALEFEADRAGTVERKRDDSLE